MRDVISGRPIIVSVKKIDIFSLAGSDKVRVYHLIVKSQPQNEVARRFLQPSHTFEKVTTLSLHLSGKQIQSRVNHKED